MEMIGCACCGVVDCTSDSADPTFITTFFKPIRHPATGFSLGTNGSPTVPVRGGAGLLPCNWLNEASARSATSALA